MLLSPAVPMSILAGFAGAAALLLSVERPSGQALLGRFLKWQDRQRQRLALLDLDDRLLRDVGLTQQQAEQEGNRRD